MTDADAGHVDSPDEVIALLTASMGEADGAKVERPEPRDEEVRHPSAADVIGGLGMTEASAAVEGLAHPRDEGPP